MHVLAYACVTLLGDMSLYLLVWMILRYCPAGRESAKRGFVLAVVIYIRHQALIHLAALTTVSLAFTEVYWLLTCSYMKLKT